MVKRSLGYKSHFSTSQPADNAIASRYNVDNQAKPMIPGLTDSSLRTRRIAGSDGDDRLEKANPRHHCIPA